MNECFQKGLRLKKIKKVAGAVGFEPTNAGSKSRCLTAWRRPNVSTINVYRPRLLSPI